MGQQFQYLLVKFITTNQKIDQRDWAIAQKEVVALRDKYLKDKSKASFNLGSHEANCTQGGWFEEEDLGYLVNFRDWLIAQYIVNASNYAQNKGIFFKAKRVFCLS